MVTAKELLDYMREKAYKPLNYKELEKHFEIDDAEHFKQLLQLLNQLEEAGEIVRTRKDKYGVPERMNLIRGHLQAHPKGFGFLIPEDREHADIYIHANDFKSAMNGDTLLVRVVSKSYEGRMEGEVVRIVKRANTTLVGTFQSQENVAFFFPDDKRISREIFIPQEAWGGAVDGMKVVVRITVYPEGRSAAQGEVIEVLGQHGDPGVDILSIIRKHNLPEVFPDDVLAEADAVPGEVSEADLAGRRDLRDKTIVTIDGEDAKDLDDAVHIEKLENGDFLLGVHIADVGYYVRENAKLDQEAYHRGCSVYLVDRVIPMLPPRLSNGICSLHPHVDRLTLTCEMQINGHGHVVRHEIYTSVIRTTERMTYTNVRKIVVDKDAEVMEKYAGLVDTFAMMEQLALILREKRMRRGAVDFDFPEAKVIVDDQGKAVDIIRKERSIAEKIIEEFMLAANETVAEHFSHLKMPFLYRIHEEPAEEKLETFAAFASNFGYVLRHKGTKIHPRSLQNLLDEIEGSKEQTVISTMMLRSMKQAKYDAECVGHFGLAAEFYSHFTSPIRRYPDLVIHRIIREVLENGGVLAEERHDYLAGRMPDIALQSSERERVAVDAERDTDALKKAEYMLDKVGEEFEGIISSVTSFGMFVELENTVEGLIRLSDLTDDYYHFHEAHMTLIGERTSKIYRIGDEVKVRVARVNVEESNIDFEMVDMKPRKNKVSLVGASRRGEEGRGKAGSRSKSGKKPGGGKPGSGRTGNGESEHVGRQSGNGEVSGGKSGSKKVGSGKSKKAGAKSGKPRAKKGKRTESARTKSVKKPSVGRRKRKTLAE